MNVLVACEESQTVCKAFRALGHRTFSCDLQHCSGGRPEWHIQGDCLPLLNGNCTFQTADTHTHTQRGEWDLLIAHPPCTFLTTAANQCHSLACYSKDEIAERTLKRIAAMAFFMKFVTAKCRRICIENPTGVMNTCYRKPDQTIEPYYFADSWDDEENYCTKKTGLWLFGLPPLQFSFILPNPIYDAPTWQNGKRKNWTEAHSGGVTRSKTFPGIARAMAEQWAGENKEKEAYERTAYSFPGKEI